MRSLMRLRAALFATTAGACAGGLVLLALSGERVAKAAQFVGANIAPAIATPDAPWEPGPDFALCQPAATARARVRRQRSAAVGWPRLARLQGHHGEPGRAKLFRSGSAADPCLQSRGGATRIPQIGRAH